MYALTNCDIFTGEGFHHNKAILVSSESIEAIVDNDKIPCTHETIDLEGKTVAPGFIDIQVNGGGGILFNDIPTAESIKTIAEAHLKFGTTNILPTFITGSKEGMRQAIRSVEEALENKNGILGIHYEGPFLNEDKAGVHDKNQIRKASQEELNFICKPLKNGIKLITLAPEKVSGDDINFLVKNKALVSIGHSNATYKESMLAFKNGISCVTHLHNAMSPFTSREPGIVGASLDSDNTWAGIIVDGYHVDFASVRVSYKAKSKGKMFLVTDAMPPVGSESSDFSLSGYDITVKDGRCVTEDGVLAGSALDMASAVRNCIQRVGIDRGEALRMASTYPAQFLGVDNILGYVKPGYKANLVIFNNQINVTAVVLEGKLQKFK